MSPGALDTTTLLRRNLVFGQLDDATLEAVAEAMVPLALPGGRTLMAQGEPSDALYVLRSGSLGVFRAPEAGGDPQLSGVVVSGETIGALALLTDQPSLFTVRALRDSELLRLPREAFQALAEEHPKAILGAAQSALRRLLAEDAGPPKLLPRTFALLPFDAGVPARELAERLRHALLPFGDCLVIDAALGRDRDSTWFAERESEVRFILYVADAGDDPSWRELCRRQGDALVLLVNASESASPWPDRASLNAHAALERPRHLLLLHAGGRIEPGAARRWRQALSGPLQHHHVRDDRDLARVARLLAHRSTGLVLSGGGARGFAMIGAIRALREAGIDIDAVGGTSIGAIIGAGVACEWDDATMRAAYHRAFVQGRPLRDRTLPLVAISRGGRTTRLLHEAFGERDIEDLALPFFAVTADLTCGEAHIARQGRLWRWLRASSAIPGVLPPLFRHHHVYVDGAVINNLPTDIMVDDSLAHIIACDIGAEDALRSDLDGASLPGFWRQWLQRRRRPNLISILVRSGTVDARIASDRRRQLATTLLTPPLGRIGMLEWQAYDHAIDIGYRYTADVLASTHGQAPLQPSTLDE